MKFSKTKCKMLHLDQGRPNINTVRGMNRARYSIPIEQNLGILVEEKLDMNHQGALVTQKAKHVLGSIKRRVVSRLSEVIYFFFILVW